MSDFGTARRRTFGELPVDTISSVQTAATGTNYVTLPSVANARMVRFMNPSTDLEVRVGSEGATLTAKADQETLLYVQNNSNELQVRRHDESNTQVVVELAIGVY